VQRALNAIDREALDRIVCETLAERVAAQRSAVDASRPGGDDEVTVETIDDDAGDSEVINNDTGDNEAVDDEAVDGDDETGERELHGVAVDGKSLRGAIQPDGRAVHLLSALTHTERVVIAQQEVDHKTNEIKLFRPLLEDLDIEGALVTADAMHTQDDHARFLVEEKMAQFLLIVKENQPSLYNEVGCRSVEKFSEPYTETCKGHGRIESRSIRVSGTPEGLVEFPHVAQVLWIEREVHDAKTKELRFKETVLAVTSASAKLAGPKRLLRASREHWGIENGLHWVRDTTMREDASKVRSGSAPRALATLRNLVISVLRLAGATNIAKSLRSVGRRPEHAFTLLGL
jgi:predicted transposase YbfD/YdcC